MIGDCSNIKVRNFNRWLAALRGKKFKQHFGGLFGDKPNRVCALGVAYQLAGGIEAHKKNPFTISRYEFLRDWLGIDESTEARVIRQNDRHKKSFKDIAKMAEKDLIASGQYVKA